MTRECDKFDLIFEPAEVAHQNFFRAAGARIFIVEVDVTRVRAARCLAEVFATPRVISGGALRAAALRLYHESRATDNAAPLLIEGLALELLAHCARERFGQPAGPAPRWLWRVRERLDAEAGRGTSLSLMADDAGVHPVYLSRAFRKYYGCSPGEYARGLQVEVAMRLLKATDVPARPFVALPRRGFGRQHRRRPVQMERGALHRPRAHSTRAPKTFRPCL